jgi:hypothetical protein
MMSHDKRPRTTTNTIPAEIRESLRRYVEEHIATGSFLAAVLSNDLFGAVARADDDNAKLIPAIVSYIYNQLPAHCYGSPDKYRKWTENIPF